MHHGPSGTRHPGRPAGRPAPADQRRLARLTAYVGSGLWAVALLVLAGLTGAGVSVPGWWLWACVAGLVIGLVGGRYAQASYPRWMGLPANRAGASSEHLR